MASSRKLKSRERTRIRIRKKIAGTAARPRLSVYRSSKHIYAQLVLDEKSNTVVAASTLDAAVADKIKVLTAEAKPNATSSKSVIAARAVGNLLAERALVKGIEAVVFDRGGYLYHGRIKAIADGAREGGLKF